MITRPTAIALVHEHLGHGVRARHSLFVGYVMGHLATSLGADAELWEVTGICHDLDFEVTKEDRGKHGILTANWLRDELPHEALLAIQSHDHRTGVVSTTPLADALKLADALAIAELDIGREALLAALRSDAAAVALIGSLTDRPYLPNLVLIHATRLGLTSSRLAEIFVSAPRQ